MTTTEDIAVLHRIAASLSADLADGGVTAAAIENEVVPPGRARSLVQERDEAIDALETTLGRAIKAERERNAAKDMAALWKEATRRAMGNRDLRARLDTADRTILLVKAKKAEAERDDAEGALKAYVTAQASRSARQHLEAAWASGYRQRGGVIPAGADHMLRDPDGSIYIDCAVHELPELNNGVERRLIDSPIAARPEGAEYIEALLREAWDRTIPFESPTESAWGLANWLAERGVRVTGAES